MGFLWLGTNFSKLNLQLTLFIPLNIHGGENLSIYHISCMWGEVEELMGKNFTNLFEENVN